MMRDSLRVWTVLCAAAVGMAGAPAGAAGQSPAAQSQTTSGQAVQGQTAPGPVAAPAVPDAPAGGNIHGMVKSGSTPLPGVAVTATNTLTGRKYATTTDAAGNYAMTIPQNGRYVVRAELAAFAASTQEARLNATQRNQQADFTLMLASRAAQQEQREEATEQAAAARQQYGGAGGAQNLSLLAAAAGLIGAGTDTGNAGAALPSLAGNSDFSGDSVAVSGQAATTNPFAGLNTDQIRQSFENMEQQQALSRVPGQGGESAQSGGLPDIFFGGGGIGGGGGRGGGGGGRRGGGGGGGGNFRNFRGNQPHGAIFWNGGNSALDAQPFSVRAQETGQPAYATNRFGATLAAAPYIPKLMEKPSTRDFLFLTLSGQRSSTPFSQFGTLPTTAERDGSAYGLTPDQIVPEATALLKYLPPPNLLGTSQNYYRLTTQESNSINLGARLIHNFGASAAAGPGGLLAQYLGRAKGLRQNVNGNFNYSNSSGDIINLFPSLGGNSKTHNYSLSLGYTLGYGKWNNQLTLNWNRSNSTQNNLFTNVQDVATDSGILGPDGAPLNPDPLNWGLPNLVFSEFDGFNQTQASFRTTQTVALSETSSWIHGHHNIRFGGDVRRVHLDFLGGTNATGAFYFTGFSSGNSFEDFLLGKPQESAIQTPLHKDYMRSNTWDAFVQDDWRVSAKFTILAGLRYEYFSPYAEKYDRLSVLDHSPDFSIVKAVFPNDVGPYSGQFPRTLIYPDRTAFSPRLGFAVRPLKDTVVRGGYAINYTTGQYGSFIQNLAFQPPFANVQTNEVSQGAVISLGNGFPAPQKLGTYSVNNRYRLPYVQVWNLDVQRTLPMGIVLNVGYNGAKGTRLDVLSAPGREGNSSVSGVLFNFEDSVAFSNFNALAVRARKRLQNGVSMGATYTYSHSIDNASSVGGTGNVVAQNWQNLRAEESNSSFDQRHNLRGDFLYELPFGPDKHYLDSGSWISKTLGDWVVQGSFTFASGTALTPSFAAAEEDVSRGTAGSLRPNRDFGESITAGGGSLNRWFNTDAFTPLASGQLYGTASRYSIPGPGTVNVNMALSKTFQFAEMRGLEVRATANNAFNIVQYAGVNTQVGSPALGEVTRGRSMRQITLLARYRF